jgi:hypothetical protein
MPEVEARRSYRGLSEKLDILAVPCQYMLSLMLFMTDNQNNILQKGLNVHTWIKYKKQKSTLHPCCKSYYFSDWSYSGIGNLIHCLIMISTSRIIRCSVKINFISY